MNEQSVTSVYDRLIRFESRRHGSPYPIHKRLSLPDATDVYALIAQGLELKPGSNILDAGCGTGYGSRILATATGCHTHGISVSADEVEFARKHAAQREVAKQLSFSETSFDCVAEAQYDLVVAVESVKHSPRLPDTISTLLAALRPGGRLIIVDDVLTGRPDGTMLQRLQAAWALTRVYSEADFTPPIAATAPHILDLTPHVRARGGAALWLRRQALKAARRLRPGKHDVFEIFQAGLDLEMLYRQRFMRYLMMSWHK
ncbi:MAG: class I SAM-dependent methyltransferase [Pseudomonadota bacterium]